MSANIRFSDEKQELTAKQQSLIALLLAHHTYAASAKVLGVNEKTIRGWVRLPHFQAAYSDVKKQVFDDAISELQTSVGDAIGVLKGLMDDEEVQAADRIRAAKIVLEQAIATSKTADMEKKIKELEKLLPATSADINPDVTDYSQLTDIELAELQRLMVKTRMLREPIEH